jgi:hypothetical protein
VGVAARGGAASINICRLQALGFRLWTNRSRKLLLEPAAWSPSPFLHTPFPFPVKLLGLLVTAFDRIPARLSR